MSRQNLTRGPRKVRTVQHMPSELLIEIAKLLPSPVDLLSFSLVCKRYYRLILANTHDTKDPRLQLILKRFIVPMVQLLKAEPTEYHIANFNSLPNGGLIHGSRRTYILSRSRFHLNTKINSRTSKKSQIFIKDEPTRTRILNACLFDHQCLLQTEEYIFGRKQGTEMKYDRSGKIIAQCQYVDGEKEGNEIFYWSHPYIRRITPYSKGKEQGNILVFSENGILAHKAGMKGGRKEGEEELYSSIHGPPMILQRCQHAKGHREGTSEAWYESGVRMSLAHWSCGSQNGTQTTWHPSGTVKSITNFVNGKRQGIEELYEENGKLRSKEQYDQGQVVVATADSSKKKKSNAKNSRKRGRRGDDDD